VQRTGQSVGKMVLYLLKSLNRTMCGGDMSPYLLSGAKPQPPNVFLDIIGAYVSAGWGKVVIFSVIRSKSGCTVPHSKKWGYAYPTYLP